MRLYALLTGTRQNFDGERHEANRIFHSVSEESRSFIVAVHILPQPPACGKNDISRESAEIRRFYAEKAA